MNVCSISHCTRFDWTLHSVVVGKRHYLALGALVQHSPARQPLSIPSRIHIHHPASTSIPADGAAVLWIPEHRTIMRDRVTPGIRIPYAMRDHTASIRHRIIQERGGGERWRGCSVLVLLHPAAAAGCWCFVVACKSSLDSIAAQYLDIKS